MGESRWRHRPVRRVQYDACWADGRVDFDVTLTSAMYRGWPADFAPISDSVHANCPEVGTGLWVNEHAAVIDGPAVRNPAPPGPLIGRPRPFGVIRHKPNPRARLAPRLSLGLGSIGAGALLVTGPFADGILGVVGAICCMGGAVSLVGLVPGRFRF